MNKGDMWRWGAVRVWGGLFLNKTRHFEKKSVSDGIVNEQKG